MTRKLALRPARAKAPANRRKAETYPWLDDDEYIIINTPNIYEADEPTGILDAYGTMIMKTKEPIGYTHF